MKSYVYIIFFLLFFTSLSYAAELTDNHKPIGEYCSPLPNVNEYIVIFGDVELEGTDALTGNYYITGELDMSGSSKITGDIYVVGEVEVEDNAVIIGHVYSEDEIELDDNGYITETTCQYGRPIEPPSVDDNQFVIDTQSNALTCEPHLVTLTVLNSDGDLDTGYTGEVTISVQGDVGSWSVINAKNTVNNITGGSATYLFDNADNGQVDLALAITTATDERVVMSQGALASDPADISFHSSMLKTELSCINDAAKDRYCVNTANKPFSLTLSAVRKNEETTLCESYNPTQILFWSDFVTPSSLTGLDVEIDGNNIGQSFARATPIDLTFSGGVATVAVNYPDAGAIVIHVKDAGNSNFFGQAELIVNPLKLVISPVDGNPAESSTYKPATSTIGFQRAAVRKHSSVVDVDVFDVRVGDLFLLCSDGLYNAVADDEIMQCLRESSLEIAVNKLIQTALDNQASDNVSVILVKGIHQNVSV